MNSKSIEEICANIDSLRKAYGDTLDSLADYLHCSKSTVSNYCNNRVPDNSLMSKISKRYKIPQEVILTCDLTGIGNISYNPDIFYKSVFTLMPVWVLKEGVDNDSFIRAHDYHKSVFDSFSTLTIEKPQRIAEVIGDFIDKDSQFEDSLAKYEEACADDKTKYVAAANYISFLCFFWIVISQMTVVYDRPAILNTIKEKIPQVYKELDSFSNSASEEEECLSILKEGRQEYDSKIIEKIKILKSSHAWSDLADYYAAFRYVIGLVDNDYQSELNSTIGMEMISTLIVLKNRYAINYFKYLFDSGLVGSQNVNDK